MSIIKVDSRIEEYRHRARANDINELSGRTHRSDLTLFVNSEIKKHMELIEGDVLVDIGCGDGTLLYLAEKQRVSCIGILPTDEEVKRVRDRFSNSQAKVRIEKGLAPKTNLPSNIASKVVCNGVFPILNYDEVGLALKEIVRISMQGALVYIGELPFNNENEGKDYGDSILKWLLWVFKTQGFGQFTIRLKQTLKAIFSKEPLIIVPKEHYYSTPEDFIKKAKSVGLIIKETFRHKSISLNKEIIESNSRQDYLFTVEKG